MNWIFRKTKELVDPMIGKTVIHFTTHGCMAQIEEFDYIGEIVGICYPKHFQGSMFYEVKVLKGGNGETTRQAPSWYLMKLNDKTFVYYD